MKFYLKAKCNHWQQPEKQKTSEVQLNKKRQNLDSDSKNGKQNYKPSKNIE